jgi:integrase
MRVGEAISLDCADVDLGRGVSTIRHSKFDKSREVPILPSVASALACYAELRVERFPRATPFFVSLKGTRLFYKNVHFVYHETVKRVGIASSLPGCRPRVHDLRHSFAIRAMARIEAIDDRDAAEAARVRLSTYLGHFDVSSTYWYLEATPELLGPALRKLEARKAEEP